MIQRWDDLTPEEQARYEDREKLLAQLAAVTAARDDYRSKFRDLEHELSLERGQVVAQQQRAEAAEAHAVTWIDVTERLPEPDRRVLAVYREDYKTVIIRAVHLPAKYAACYEEYEEAEYDEETDTLYFPGGWYEAMESAEYAYIGPVSGTVTHWKEMPTLPSRA